MNKRDYIWVAIRVFGLYLLVLALIAIPQLLSAIVQVAFYWNTGQMPDAPGAVDNLDKMNKVLLASAASSFCSGLCRVILFGAAGIHLIRGGKWLFNIICPPEVESSQQTDLPPQE